MGEGGGALMSHVDLKSNLRNANVPCRYNI